MDEHLSDFALDDLVYSGRPTPAHVRGCALCQERLQERYRSYQATKGTPEFDRTLTKVLQTGRRPSKVGWPVLVGGVAVAVSAVVSVLVPNGMPSRPSTSLGIKGEVKVSILRDLQPMSAVTAGDQISLVVSAGGHRHALLLAVAEDGAVSQLWPVGTSTSGRVGGGASERLMPEYRITPGSFAIHAIFSDTPIDGTEGASHVRKAVTAGRASGLSPLEAVVPPLSDSSSMASCMVRVWSPS